MSDYTVTLEAPAAIVQADTRSADEVRKRIQEIDSKLTLSTFELGDLFAEVKAKNYWNEWKFESFSEYTKSTGIDLSPRQIEYMIQISRVSKTLEIPKTALAKAKNSKLKEIFSLDQMAEVVDETTGKVEKMSDIMVALVADAPNKTLTEVKEIVKRLKGTPEDPAGELTWLNLPVRRDAKQVVVGGLEKAAAMAGQTIDTMTKELKDMSMAAALELVVGDWLADPNNEVDEETEAEEFADEVDSDDDNEDEQFDEDSDDDE